MGIGGILGKLVPGGDLLAEIGGSLIGAAVFIGIGLGGWYNWNYLWPLILIAVGINVLVTGFKRKR